LYKVMFEEKWAPVILHPIPLWIHQNSEKLLDPPILAIQTSTNDNKALNKGSSLANWPSSSKHQLLHTLHSYWIHHNS
jgi:hypothetical protein